MSSSPFSRTWSALSGKHLHLQEPPPPPPPPPSSQLRAASAAPPAAQQSPPSKPQRRLFRSENKLAKSMSVQCRRHLVGLIIVSKFKIQRKLNLIGINSAQPQKLNNWSKSKVSHCLINYPDGISRPQTTTLPKWTNCRPLPPLLRTLPPPPPPPRSQGRRARPAGRAPYGGRWRGSIMIGRNRQIMNVSFGFLCTKVYIDLIEE